MPCTDILNHSHALKKWLPTGQAEEGNLQGYFCLLVCIIPFTPPPRNNKFSRLAFLSISYRCAGLHLSASPIPQTLTFLNSSYRFQPLTLFNFYTVLLSVNCRFYVCASICPILAFCHLTRRSYRVEQAQHLFQLVRCLIGYFNLYHGWLLSVSLLQRCRTLAISLEKPCRFLSLHVQA